MAALIVLGLFAAFVGQPLVVPAIAAFVFGFVVMKKVSDASGAGWGALALLAWWGGCQYAAIAVMRSPFGKWVADRKQVLMSAHVASICLFWVGMLICVSADARLEAAMNAGDMLAFAIGYAVVFTVAVPVLLLRQRRKAQATR